MNTILEIDSLKKYYGKPGNQTKALNGITFQVMEGEFLGIMGSSGSGKSTLLNCIATVIQPSSGRIVMRGTQIQSLKGKKLAQYRGREIGYLFQNASNVSSQCAGQREQRQTDTSGILSGDYRRA